MRRSELCRKLNVKVRLESRLSECRQDPSNRNNKWILNQGARAFDCCARAHAGERLQDIQEKLIESACPRSPWYARSKLVGDEAMD